MPRPHRKARRASFDPEAAALPGSGIFGLPHSPEQARFVVVPVPFDATTSYRDGTRHGPAAILAASRQVDLHDLDFGDPWEQGIAMLPLGSGIAREAARLNREARSLARPIIESGGTLGATPRGRRALERLERIGAELNRRVEETTAAILAGGGVAVLVGGDHSVPFGAIRAQARRRPGLGILHVDAHADLRDAYEGFRWSHASIMHNVVEDIGVRGGIGCLVQVAIRDVSQAEHEASARPASPDRPPIHAFPDPLLQARKLGGEPWTRLAEEIVAALPAEVYLSLDIDGLEPALCPDTGTPVPGGLGFAELVALLRALVASRRKLVGCDLVEVAPSSRTPAARRGEDWNAIVGARVLYKVLGALAASER